VSHPVCGGIDVHAAQLTACLRRGSEDGQSTTEVVEYGTTYGELGVFRSGLQAHQCPIVALESPGGDGKLVYHVLRKAVEMHVANRRDVRQRPAQRRTSVMPHGLRNFWLMG
jgi:hypothetical protein